MQTKGSLFAVFLLALAIAGCDSLPGAAPVEGGASNSFKNSAVDTCSARGAQAAVGKQATAMLVNEARIAAGARLARVLRPAQFVSKEYLAGRLNLEVDFSGVVLKVVCG